jgi:hypothetical protein
MKAPLAMALLLACSTASANIGSPVVIRPDASNPGPLPPHMTQPWQGSIPPPPVAPAYAIPLPTGSVTVQVVSLQYNFTR